MNEPTLIMTLPTGNVTATSLGIEGLAHHHSPGSGKHFHGRSIMVDLAIDGEKPSFKYLDEGGWRDPYNDSVAALDGVRAGSRTKTALSNSAFSCIPITAYKSCHLVKTGGETTPLEGPKTLVTYSSHTCNGHMTPEQVAQAVGRPLSVARVPRLYMVISPIQLIMLSTLTPEEYAWYATHRPGKCFRQVMFTELSHEQPQVAAKSRFDDARQVLAENSAKKTKAISVEDCINQIPFRDWVGYQHEADGGLYVGDREHLVLYPFPAAIPHSWDKLEG